MRARMMKILTRLVADTLLIGVLLFSAAGTFDWWRAWLLLAVLLFVRVATAINVYRINPALLQDRAKLPIHHGQPSSDRLLVLAVLVTGFAALPLIAALDVFRWQLLPRPPLLVSIAGLVLFALGWSLKGVALRTNAFATTAVRLQGKRHVVVDSGVYRIVRHPFYAGTLLVLIGLPLWLESVTALLCALVPIAFLTARIVLEERFLRRELPGYADYAARVPRRLLPGIW